MMKKLLVFLILVSVAIGCGNSDREKQLQQREQALQIRIDSFAAKETEFQSLLKMRDSLAIADSLQKRNDSISAMIVKPWADSLAGKWNGRLICIESNCSDYVIGDQRVNTWDLASDSLGLYAHFLNNKNEIVRTYNANFLGDNVVLIFKTDASVATQVQIRTVLNDIANNKLKGTQTIVKENDCIAKFSVELTRPTTNKKTK